MAAPRILLFGAAGQLGQELLVRAGASKVAVFPRARDEADIADRDAVVAALRATAPHFVVNAAAYTDVDKAESEPHQAWRANAIGPGVLAAACADLGIPLVQLSTDYVFDGKKSAAYDEDDVVSPLSVYGVSKAGGEQAVRAGNERHLILRTSWLYGVYGRNFLRTILRLAKEHDELRVVADQRGCPTSTADVAEAILTLAPQLAEGDFARGTYHFVGEGATTWYEFARQIVKIQEKFTKRRPQVIAIPTAEYRAAAARPSNSELDARRFAAAFGFRAKPWQDRTSEAIEAVYA